MFDLISIGDNCVDIYRDKEGKVCPGGNAVNVAVYARRENIKVSYLGFFGTDRFGVSIRESMLKEEIQIDYCNVVDGPNGYTIVELKDGERVFVESDLAVQKKFYIPQGLEGMLSSSKINFFSGFTSWIDNDSKKNTILDIDIKVLSGLRKVSNCIAFDFSDINDFNFIKPLAQFIDLAFISFDLSKNKDHQKFLDEVYKFFNNESIIILTMGKDGSVAYGGDKFLIQKAIKTEVIDSLGCGDAFIGSFLAEYIKSNGNIKKSLSKGARVASKKIKRFGAW